MSVIRRLASKLVPNAVTESRQAILRVEAKTNELSGAIHEINNKISYIDTRVDRLRSMVRGLSSTSQRTV